MLLSKHNPKPSQLPTCQQWGAETPCQDNGSPSSDPVASPGHHGQTVVIKSSLSSLDRATRSTLSLLDSPTQSIYVGDDLSSDLKLHALISSVLRDGWMPGDPRTFDYITRDAEGFRGWKTHKNHCLDSDSAAVLVLLKDIILGLKHRAKTRKLAIDFDNHSSLEWTRDDPQILALIRAAEAAGCGAELVPSPHGFHLWLTTPEPVPVVRGHWILRTIQRRAGVEGQEVFPSLPHGDAEPDAKKRPTSHGIRLPGQSGTVVPGDPFTDPGLIWAALRAHLDRLKPTPAWHRLLQQARALERRHKRRTRSDNRSLRLPPSHAAGARMVSRIHWSGPGESNKNLGNLATAGYIAGNRSIETLAPFIEERARLAPGFSQHASADTKGRLAAWARDWAACCIARPPRSPGTGSRRPPSNDPGRNQRLHREAVCALLDTARDAARTYGRDALSWSERKIEKVSGVARSTIRRLRFHWSLRVAFFLNRPKPDHPAVGGSDPSHQGGDSAVSQEKNISLPASPPQMVSDSSEKPSHPPPGIPEPTLLPTVPKKFASPSSWEAVKCSRERDELLQWLAMPSA